MNHENIDTVQFTSTGQCYKSATLLDALHVNVALKKHQNYILLLQILILSVSLRELGPVKILIVFI